VGDARASPTLAAAVTRYGPTGYTDHARALLTPWSIDGNHGDLTRVTCVPALVAHELMRALPDALLDARIEHDPPMRQLLELAVTLPHCTLNGYLVGSERDDERVWWDMLRWRGRRRLLPDLIVEYRPRALEARGTYVVAWWH
jgi:hypothetical protein